jgi:hypothetical protein
VSRVLVISLSDLARDPRVDRQIGFLRPGYEIVAAGLGPPAESDVEFIDLRPPPTPKPRGLVRKARSLAGLAARRSESVYWRHPLNRLGLGRLAGHGADLLIANDLSALPLACRVAAGAPVIFDAHELYTEEHADRAWWRAIMSPYADALLRRYLPQTAGMMTVAPGIAERYARRYGVEPVVVTNAPAAANLAPTPVDKPIRLIHHGAADPQRRLELMIEMVDLLDDRFELSLMLVPADSRYFARLERLAASRPKVRLVAPRAPRDIIVGCNAHDVGVYLLPPGNDNLRYALPNKLFEFLQARLAIAIGPSPEMARVVREHGCGVVADDFTPAALADCLRDLTPERIWELKQHADRAAVVLCAERNSDLVLKLVRDALGG